MRSLELAELTVRNLTSSCAACNSVSILVILGLLCQLQAFGQPGNKEPKSPDGTIVTAEPGLPFDSYEAWQNSRTQAPVFDEAEFRKSYPPERFAEYKDSIHCPFATWEEWLENVRRKTARKAGLPRISDSDFQKQYPRTEFDQFERAVTCTRIQYVSDGLKVEGFILRPKDTMNQKLPVVIYNRGGSAHVGSIDFEKLFGLRFLAYSGYVVVASQYRGCDGREGRDEMGGADVDDVLNLIRVVDSLPYADPKRIGMFGWSRGGLMTYRALARTDRISAAVIVEAPPDVAHNIRQHPEMRSLLAAQVPDFESSSDDAIRLRSAAEWPEKISRSAAILLIQGGLGDHVDPVDVLRMAIRLRETDHRLRLVLFEDGDHQRLSGHEAEVQRLILDWFAKYLAAPK